MTAGETAIVAGSLAGLIAIGWLFLDHSLYRGHEDKDRVVQARPLPTQSMVAQHRCRLNPHSIAHPGVVTVIRPLAHRGADVGQ